jgi:hypothetical protein
VVHRVESLGPVQSPISDYQGYRLAKYRDAKNDRGKKTMISAPTAAIIQPKNASHGTFLHGVFILLVTASTPHGDSSQP